MAASTREVFLLLRARDEASRVLRGFSSELTRSSALVQAAAMRTRATELQREVSARRQEAAVLAAAAADKMAAAAAQAKRVADARSIGTSDQRIYSMREVERRLKAEAAEINNRIRVMDKETSAMVAEIRMLDRQSSELERAHRAHRALAQAITITGAALGTLGVGFIAVGAAATYFFIQSFKSFQEYQRQVALTHTQIDGFAASLTDVSNMGLKIANEIPVAFQQIQPALFDIFSSTNANLKQSQALLEGFAKAAVAGQTDIQTAARGTLAIMNGLNIPFEDVNHILDVQFELVRKGVGTYEEFAKVFGRIIPAANRSQQSFETVAAMLAFMTRNGQSAAQAATAAARALELFTHPTAVKGLTEMGVKVQDLKGNYLPLIDILKQLRTQLRKIPQGDRVAKLVDMFKGAGFNIQARRFLEQVVLGAGELENFEALLGSMGNAAGVMGEKYAEMADTAASKTQLLANRWEILKVTFGEAVAPVLLELMDLLSRLLQWFNNLDPATKKMITNVGLIATAFAFVAGTALVFLGLLAGIVAAVVAAGSSFAIVTGAVLILGAAFIALTAAVGLAWAKSEEFRNIVRDCTDDVKDFWTEIETLGSRISDAFKSADLPALEKLQDTIENKVLPVLRTFRDEVVDIIMPKVMEALRLLTDFSENTLKNVGSVINEFVIPGLATLSDWWAKNKDELEPFIKVLAMMVKWFIIVAGVVLASGLIGGLGALLTIVGLVAGVFYLAIESFKLTKVALAALVDFLLKANEVITEKILGILAAIVSGIGAGINAAIGFIRDNFTAAIAFLVDLWEGFWSTFGDPIKAAWELVLAIVDLGIALLMLPIEGAIGGLRYLWEAFWGAFGEPIKAAWSYITSRTEEGTSAVSAWFGRFISYVTGIWDVVWTAVSSAVSTAWHAVTKAVADGTSFVINLLIGWRQRLLDTVKGAVSGVVNFFTNLRDNMYEMGANIIEFLINGITSKFNALTDKVKGIAQKIKDFFPSSPAKTGPLSGKGSPFKSGQAISNMLAAGMLYQTDAVRNASMQLASAVAPSPNFAGQGLLAPVGLGGPADAALTPMRSNNVTVNVYTNEIDPRITATELGWELEARL